MLTFIKSFEVGSARIDTFRYPNGTYNAKAYKVAGNIFIAEVDFRGASELKSKMELLHARCVARLQ